MHRFFVDPKDISQDYAVISGSDAKHAKMVLRLTVSDELLFIDGEGREYTGFIEEISTFEIRVKISSCKEYEKEPKIKVTLIQSLLKGDKMEYITQKCTELGISSIIPCSTERCVVKEDKKDSNKIKRLRRIAQESSKQCGRSIVPFVEDIHNIDEVLNLINQRETKTLFVLPWELETSRGLKEIISELNTEEVEEIFYAIGPEGGFAREEVEKAIEKANAVTVTLGKRILRADTAAISVAAMILFGLGEMG